MNALKRHPVLTVAGLVMVLLLAALFARRQSLLINYHHHAMVSIWRDQIGMPREKSSIDEVRELFGINTAASPGSSDPDLRWKRDVKIYRHREALVRLGYYVKRDFELSPRAVDLPLIHAVAAQAKQQPVAQFKYDDPMSPTQKVVGLTVYAPASDMPQWAQFVAELRRTDTLGAEQ